jgi:spermidine/putrescine-binding protein
MDDDSYSADDFPREPTELTREQLVRYGLVGGATVFFLGAKTAASAVWNVPPKPAKKPARLVVRNWGDPWRSYFAAHAGKTFTAATGIPVSWDLTDDNVIQTKCLAAIRSGQRPPVDAVMNTSTNAYLAYVQKIATPIDSQIATNLAACNKLIAAPGGRVLGYPFLGMYSYGIPAMYRTDKVQASELSSYQNLQNSKFAKRIGLTQGFTFLSFIIAKVLHVNPATQSMDPVWKWFSDLKPNIYGALDDTAKTQALISGDAWIVFGLAGDGLAAAKAKAPVDFAVPKEGMTIDRDTYYVMRNTPKEVAYYAQVFANHLMAARNQTTMAATLGVTPAALKATLPAYMKKNPTVFPFSVAQFKGNIVTPVALAAKNASAWQAAYDQAVK